LYDATPAGNTKIGEITMKAGTRGTFSAASAVLGMTVMILQPLLGAAKFSNWSLPVNLGPLVNSTFEDFAPHISKNGLSLYFTSTRPGSDGEDIWVSQRKREDMPWEAPVNIGAPVNTISNERAASLSRDGHFLFFNSDGPDGFGGFDIWVSWRAHVHDDFAWQPPVNLGPAINTAAFDGAAAFFENDETGMPQIYFVSNRPGGLGLQDIYVSTLANGSLTPAVLVSELSSPRGDFTPVLRHDGLEILIASTRTGSLGAQDLWVATRATVFDSWSEPVNLGVLINSASNENFPSLSRNGQTLFFNSNRSDSFGGSDLYMSTRTRKP
jgi:hypothetical protein